MAPQRKPQVARHRSLIPRGAVAVLATVFVVAVAAGGASVLRGRPAVSDANLQAGADAVIGALRTDAEWDPRLVAADVSAEAHSGVVTLSGAVDGDRVSLLLEAVRRVRGVKRVEDRLLRLPDSALGPETSGLVCVAVVNLGDAPGRDEGDHLVTQARLGDAVEVLREQERWLFVRMADDGYLGWVRSQSVVRLTPAALETYVRGGQALVTAKVAAVLGAVPGATGVGSGPDLARPPLLQAVMGTVLKAGEATARQVPGAGPRPGGGYIEVTLPDGRTGFLLESDARLLASAVAVWTEARPAEDVIALAGEFLGLPYLWGGTTSQGFDCSGFVQFVFGLSGYKLPRDADMQFATGTPVSARSDLVPGDLVFWSTYKAGPSHVGIYVGGSRYIHSGSTGVAINSFDPKAPEYDERLDQAYIGARRVIAVGG